MPTKNYRLLINWRNSPAFNLFLFIAIIFIVRVFLRGNLLELDEAEQVVKAQHLLVGYAEQPPLYSWMQFICFKLFGVNILSLALVKCSLLFACLYFYHQIARLHCQSNLLAWAATVSWALIPSISLDLIKDNTHSVLALFAACATWYWLIKLKPSSKFNWYFIFGLILGVGLLSKFNYLIFISILFVAAATVPQYRNKLLNPRILFSCLIALALSSPYFLWIYQHANVGLHSTYKLTTKGAGWWTGTFALTKASFLFLGPVFISFWLFNFAKYRHQKQSPLKILICRYHIFCLPFLLAIIFLSELSRIEARWLIPILFLFPVLCFGSLKMSETIKEQTKIKRYIILCLSVQAALLLALIVRGHSGHIRQNRFNIEQVVNNIKTDQQAINYLVSDSYLLLGNLMMKLSIKKGWYLHPARQFSLPQGNLLFIWQTPANPVWLDYFAKSYKFNEIKRTEEPIHHQIIARRTYLFCWGRSGTGLSCF